MKYRIDSLKYIVKNLDVPLFGLFLVVLAYKAWTDAAFEWDNIAYHLPFAALRVGILDADHYILHPWLQKCFEGFPLLMDYLKGGVWKLTGNINSTSLISVLIVALYCVYNRIVFNLKLVFSFAILCSIPTLQAGFANGNLDFIANVSFTMALLCATYVYIHRMFVSKKIVLFTFLFSAFAANTKSQVMIPAGIFSFIFLSYYLFEIRRNHKEFLSSSRTRLFLVSILFVFVSTYFIPLRNLFFFGNPLYPIQVTILGITLPGTNIDALYPDPAYLRNAIQPFRWILSALEYRALDLRPVPYLLGMGDVPSSSYSSRMGGFFGFLFVFNLWLFFTLTLKNENKRYVMVAIAFVVFTVFISLMPSSHELRYFSFVMLYMTSLNAVIIFNTSQFAYWRSMYTAVIVSSAIFITVVTGGINFLSGHRSFPELAQNMQITEKYTSKFEDGGAYCLVNWGQFIMLASKYFNPDLSVNYSMIQANIVDECPPNTIIVPWK